MIAGWHRSLRCALGSAARGQDQGLFAEEGVERPARQRVQPGGLELAAQGAPTHRAAPAGPTTEHAPQAASGVLEGRRIEVREHDRTGGHPGEFGEGGDPLRWQRKVLEQAVAEGAGEAVVGEWQREDRGRDLRRPVAGAEHRRIAVDLDHGRREQGTHPAGAGGNVEPEPGPCPAAGHQVDDDLDLPPVRARPRSSLEPAPVVAGRVRLLALVRRIDGNAASGSGSGLAGCHARVIGATQVGGEEWPRDLEPGPILVTGKDVRMADERSDLMQGQRRGERRRLEGDVTVEILSQSIDGPGENVSDGGVLFAALGSVRVRVRLPGDAETREGELVRLTPLGGGRLGVAVRFDSDPS